MKRKTRPKIFIGAFVFVVFLIIAIVSVKEKDSNSLMICVEDKACFDVEIASSVEDRERGLSGRESLDLDKGMFFVFPQERDYGFWMKDMSFPIDLLWIDKEGEIVGLEKNMQPCKESCEVFYSLENISYVLEINAGLAEEYNLREGDFIGDSKRFKSE
ncbi:MAG: DUF192 domain-containing protein [Nanoarchaeota archaeon]|nr:DUF192 domain-containing protein [Nanoarchaeota archaeon]